MVSNKKESQGFENSYNSYEQYPLENFFIFTIYQNYTLALTKPIREYFNFLYSPKLYLALYTVQLCMKKKKKLCDCEQNYQQ